MIEVIINEGLIEEGEAYFVVYVDKPRIGGTIVGELTMGLVGPVTADIARPRTLSGFELPALEMVQLAHERAAEQGVTKILLVDPHGLLPLAKINRYARQR